MHLNQTIIRFPELKLKSRDAQKLRGYFGTIFREYSLLLHNHFEDGTSRYAYPLVQYKVIGQVPLLVGFMEGARLLQDLFLKIKEIDIGGRLYKITSKNIDHQGFELIHFESLMEYRFETLWMALNQKNFSTYSEFQTENAKVEFLKRQLRNNILSFYKGIGFYTPNRVMVTGSYVSKFTSFKGNQMLAFSGKFVTNAILPDYVGIGKAVSRGFGTVIKTSKNEA